MRDPGVRLSGQQADQFELTGTCATRGQANPLGASQTCTVVVGFQPKSTPGIG